MQKRQLSAASTRYLHSSHRLSDQEAPARPRAQDTTQELARRFYQSNDAQREDIRKLDTSLPNRSFRRNRDAPSQIQPHTASPTNIFSYDNPRQNPSPNTEPQSQDQRAHPRTSRQAPAGAVDARSLAASPRTGAIDARSFGASPSPGRTLQRSRPAPGQTTRSKGAGAGIRSPRYDSAHKSPSSAGPARRPRQLRSDTFAQSSNAFDVDSVNMDGMSEEEQAYYREKKDAKVKKLEIYRPAEVTLETLSGMGPRLVLGRWGMEECVVDWVEGAGKERGRREGRALGALLGDRVESGKEEKDKRRIESTEGDKQTQEVSGKVVEMLRKGFEGRLAERVFKGEYVFEGRDENGVLDTLRRQAVRNATYHPKDGASLTEKVRSMLPAANLGGARRAASF